MLLRVPKGAIEIDQIVDEDVDWENIDDIVPSRLCFVYQSQDMQRVYRKYAPHLEQPKCCSKIWDGGL